MQTGFALMEAGNNSGNTLNQMYKAVAGFLVTLIAWFTVGYAFAYGTTYYDTDPGSRTTSTQWFIGNSGYFLQNVNPCVWPTFFFQFTLAAVATTIATSSLSNRASIKAYLLYAAFIAAWVYPVVVHWTWSTNAWLAQGTIKDVNNGVGYFDYAGSGVVFVTGGTAALVAAHAFGARKSAGDSANHAYVAVGTIIVFFGFIGFTTGHTPLANLLNGVTLSLCVVNVFLAAAGGALTGIVLGCRCKGGAQVNIVCNSAVSGMVAISAGANTVYPWAGFVIGLIAGVVYMAWSAVGCSMESVTSTVAVCLGSGAWGLVAVSLFAMDQESPTNQFTDTFGNNIGGVFYDSEGTDHGWVVLGWNIFAGIVMIPAWTAFNCGAFLFILKKFGVIPDAAADEEKGTEVEVVAGAEPARKGVDVSTV